MQVNKEIRETTVEETPAVVENVRTNDGAVIAARIVWYIAGVILVLLALRFVLILLGANPGNPIVNLIYTLSYPLAAPFFGILGYIVAYGVSRVEISTLIAMAIYALIAYGIARLITINRARVE